MNLNYITVNHKLLLNFVKARDFVRKLGLKSSREWVHYLHGDYPTLPLPDSHLPPNPIDVYNDNDWQGWDDWLGLDTPKSPSGKFCSLAQARRFAREQKLSNAREWFKFVKEADIPLDIPHSPRNAYLNQGWTNWQDFLGSKNKAHKTREFISFDLARDFAQTLDLSSQEEWMAIANDDELPDDVPHSPYYIYKNSGWISWGDFLGTHYVANQKRVYRPFQEARKFAGHLHLHSVKEWYKYAKGDYPEYPHRPSDIPASPRSVYKDKGWISYTDWLNL